jgi:hypothetical protein
MFHQKSIKGTFLVTFMLILAACDNLSFTISNPSSIIFNSQASTSLTNSTNTISDSLIENSLESTNFKAVTSVEELTSIRTNLSGNFRLYNDIDLEGIEWIPIGTEATPFSGILDGQGFTISNLKITETQVYIGLFGYNQGTIKNLKLEKVDINVTGEILNNIYVGALVGFNNTNSKMENIITNSGTLKVKKRGLNKGYIGGIIGYQLDNINLVGLINKVTVTGQDMDGTGGIVGFAENKLTILLASNEGLIQGTNELGMGFSGNYIGGLVGVADSLDINLSNNKNTVSGKAFLGGLVGGANYTTIIDSYNEGLVLGSENTGGFIGFGKSEVLISDSRNEYLVQGWKMVGGFIGNSKHSIIQNSKNLGSIWGSQKAGGLVGYSDQANIFNSINVGDVDGGEWTGGLIGSGGFDIKKSTNYGEVRGGSIVGGLVGFGQGSIVDSFNHSFIYGSGTIGGLVGWNRGDSIYSNTKNEGLVSGASIIGGLIGKFDEGKLTISNCSNNGHVIGKQNDVGGLVGYIGATTTILYSWNNGNIIGNSFVGGLIGSGSSIYVYHSLNFANVTSLSESLNIGGIIGTLPNIYDFEQTFYSGNITSNGVVVDGVAFGTKVTDPSTLNLAFFTTTLDWDTEIWDFTGLDIANGVYPTLKNMPKISEFNGFGYVIKSNQKEGSSATILSSYKSGDVEIPQTIDGFIVNEIGSYSFANSKISSVIIPAGVIKIGGGAFAWNQLTELVIPLGVNLIGNYAFAWNQLTTVRLSGSVDYIGSFAFFSDLSLIIYVPATANPEDWNWDWSSSGNEVNIIRY